MQEGPRHRLPRRVRLRRRRDFLAVRRRGRSVRDEVLRIGYLPNGSERTRLGLAVPRRAGSAVERNRIKRVIREAFRTAPGLFPGGLDLVVGPADPERARSLEAVQASLRGLAARIARRLAEPPRGGRA